MMAEVCRTTAMFFCLIPLSMICWTSRGRARSRKTMPSSMTRENTASFLYGLTKRRSFRTSLIDRHGPLSRSLRGESLLQDIHCLWMAPSSPGVSEAIFFFIQRRFCWKFASMTLLAWGVSSRSTQRRSSLSCRRVTRPFATRTSTDWLTAERLICFRVRQVTHRLKSSADVAQDVKLLQRDAEFLRRGRPEV